MKKLLLLLIIGLSSCGKDEVTVMKNELAGEWNWVRKTGGIAGVNETPKKGDTFVLKINSDNTYSYISNGTEITKGKYTLGKAESMLLNKEMPTITLDENGKFMYELKGEVLYLSEDYYDGFNYEYARIK